jgi:hypothetical protein
MVTFPMVSYDHSDRIALYQTRQHILSDLHPTGEWMLFDLYQRYRLRPYGGLSIGEFDKLLEFMAAEIAALSPDAPRQWLATRHPEIYDAKNQYQERTTAPVAELFDFQG